MISLTQESFNRVNPMPSLIMPGRLMTVIEFSTQYPHYSFDFTQPISFQSRIFDQAVLATLPEELTPSHAYRGGGRGRPNLNQTLAHSQCKMCRCVLRNDFFYAPFSSIKRNVIHTYCLSCMQKRNADRYHLSTITTRIYYDCIWHYLAPRCQQCGFAEHTSAMDLHHPEAKESDITTLLTEAAARPDAYRIEKLLHESSNCVALCSNCHRMVHAGVLQLSESIKPLPYRLIELLALVKEAGKDYQYATTQE